MFTDRRVDCGENEFQLIDIQVSDDIPAETEYSPFVVASPSFSMLLPEQSEFKEKRCSVNLFGKSGNGKSVTVTVTNFAPYLFYQVSSAKTLKFQLEEFLHCEGKLQVSEMKKKKLYGWVPSENDPLSAKEWAYCKVSFPSISLLKRAVKEAASINFYPSEYKVDPVMMFFDTTSIVPCGWFKVRRQRTPSSERARFHTDIDISCVVADITPLEKEDIAPLLVASVDLECFSETSAFPDASLKGDRIAIIGTAFWRVGTPVEDATTVCYCVGKCDTVEGCEVVSFETEIQMLDAWRDLICVKTDPDIVIGYNTFGFDYPYMSTRAKLCSRFWYCNREVLRRSVAVTKELTSNAYGQNEMTTLGWIGRVDLDIFNYIKINHKFSIYKLDYVSEQLLGKKKVDLDYKELNKCLSGSPEEMARACFYCAEDCRLPIFLMKRLEILPSLVEMSRVTFTTLNQLVFRGQQIKVFNQLVWHSHRRGYILNDPPVPQGDGYEGATVIEPKPALYKKPTVVLDFASLYPSIMLEHNLCYSTFVNDEKYTGIPGVVYETHGKETFVLSTPGVLPSILTQLLEARKQAKRDKAAATCPEKKAIYDGRQLALKVSCNSVYGFTGVMKHGMFPLPAIAACVTKIGRSMIMSTAAEAESFIHKKFGYSNKVIYGDTDSVMINFRDNRVDVDTAIAVGKETADHVTQFLLTQGGVEKGYKQLEFEKVYYPYLILCKKKYIGLMYTEKGFEKMDAKGVDLVRREYCAFSKKVYNSVITPIMYDISPEKAITNLETNLKSLLRDDLPMQDFVLTKQLKKIESYKNDKQPHILVAKKIIERSKGAIVPQSGDRLEYVIVEGQGSVSEKAEDPSYARQNNVQVDYLYYIDNQIKESISKIFSVLGEEFLEKCNHVFSGVRNSISLKVEKQTVLAVSSEKDEKATNLVDALAFPVAVRKLPPKRKRK